MQRYACMNTWHMRDMHGRSRRQHRAGRAHLVNLDIQRVSDVGENRRRYRTPPRARRSNFRAVYRRVTGTPSARNLEELSPTLATVVLVADLATNSASDFTRVSAAVRTARCNPNCSEISSHICAAILSTHFCRSTDHAEKCTQKKRQGCKSHSSSQPGEQTEISDSGT